MKYKVGDMVRVTKFVGYDRVFGIKVGGVYEVVSVCEAPIEIRIKAPNGESRLMTTSQIELVEEPTIGVLQARLDELDDEILKHALARDEHKRQLKIKKKMQKAYADVMFDLKRKDDSDAE